MRVRRLLEVPALYNLKTRFFSLGRANVWRFLASLPELKPHHRILDVGCGTGRHAEIFGKNFTGVDIQREYVHYARKHHPGAFANMDATQLAFPDETFDFVYAIGLFHHLNDAQLHLAVKEMRRVLKRGGNALIVDAVLPRITNPIGFVLAQLDRGDFLRPFADSSRILASEGFTVKLRNLPGSYPYERAVFVCAK